MKKEKLFGILILTTVAGIGIQAAEQANKINLTQKQLSTISAATALSGLLLIITSISLNIKNG